LKLVLVTEEGICIEDDGNTEKIKELNFGNSFQILIVNDITAFEKRRIV